MFKKTLDKIYKHIEERLKQTERPFCHECGLVFQYEMYLEKHQQETGHKNGQEWEVMRKIKTRGFAKIYNDAANIPYKPLYLSFMEEHDKKLEEREQHDV